MSLPLKYVVNFQLVTELGVINDKSYQVPQDDYERFKRQARVFGGREVDKK